MTIQKLPVLLILSLKILFILITPELLLAQSEGTSLKSATSRGIIMGVVVDSLTKMPIQHANFQIVQINDTLKTLVTTSRKDGKFALTEIPFGSYFAKISSVGYKKRKRNLIVLTSKVRVIDLDTIKLSEKSIYLGEVNIVEKNEGVYHEKEKIIIRINKDMGENGLEILENTPMVNVDIEGNVNVAGKEDTKIYIDGVPLGMTSYFKAEDLKSLLASEIEKIEIITGHSIDYIDAANSGIINIVTKKRLDSKYSGNISSGGNTKNSFNADANFSYFYKTLIVRPSYVFKNTNYNTSFDRIKTITFNDSINIIKQIGDDQNDIVNNSGKIGLLYNPDDYNSLSASVVYNSKNTNYLQKLSTALNNELLGWNSSNDKFIGQQFIMLSANYRKNFATRNRYLNFGISYNHNNMNTEIKRNFIYPAFLEESYLRNDFSKNLNNSLSWRTGFTSPIDSNTSIALSYNGSLTRLEMKNDFYKYDYNYNVYAEDITNKNHYKNSNFRHNLSSYFSGNIFNTRYMIGINFVLYRSFFEEYLSASSFEKKYSNVFPEISLEKNLNETHKINMHWFLQYYYPMNRQINPHPDYSDSTNVIVGNPNLSPSYCNFFSADYSFFTNNLLLNLRVYYNKYNNEIEEITTQLNSTKALTTYNNLASSSKLGIGLSASAKCFEFLTIKPLLGMNHREFTGTNLYKQGT